jgi:hypothetical protein
MVKVVQTTKQMIKSHIEDDQDNWDLILDKIAFA